MIIVAESIAEADLLARRLPALRYLFGPDIHIQTPNLLTGSHDSLLHLDRTLRTLLLQDSAPSAHQQ